MKGIALVDKGLTPDEILALREVAAYKLEFMNRLNQSILKIDKPTLVSLIKGQIANGESKLQSKAY